MFEEIKNISNLSICLAHPKSSLSCFYIEEYIDLAVDNAKPFIKKRMTALKFNTEDTHSILNNIKDLLSTSISVRLIVYGDNLSKYVQEVEDTLKMRCSLSEDYCQSSATGCLLLRDNVLNEIYQYDDANDYKYFWKKTFQYPYLLVMINSKIIFIKVTSDSDSEIIYEANFDFNLILSVARVTLNVKCLEDIFNFIQEPEEPQTGDGNGTLVSNMLEAMLQNVIDIMYLHSEIHKFLEIIIGEYYENEKFMKLLKRCLDKYLKKKVNVYFMRHNGFSTAMGSMFDEISKLNIPECHNSWWENYALTTDTKQVIYNNEGVAMQTMSLDSLSARLVVFPHLKDPENYVPFIYDVKSNKKMRKFILDRTFSTKLFLSKIGVSHPIKLEKYHLLIDKEEEIKKMFSENLNAYGGLTIALILETALQLNYQLRIIDTFQKLKEKEVNFALNALPDWLKHFDDLPTNQRHEKLVTSLIAGNLIDWASPEVYKLFNSTSANIQTAFDTIPSRPWFVDDLDLWVERMKGPPHKLAAIIPDNCGFDFIFGIIPFVRELIKRGTKVILYANKEITYNDLTAHDAKNILDTICLICPIINEACKNKKLIVMEQIRSFPTVDFRYINKEFADLCKDVDLILIDGLLRAFITNFTASFSIECIKVAANKDEMLENDMGGNKFAAMFSYVKNQSCI